MPTLSHKISLALCATLLFGVSCTNDPADDAADFEGMQIHRQAIKGGTIDANSKSVIGMFAVSGRSGGVCSGTLIAPNLVLTAQHCIARVPSSYVQCGQTTFGSPFTASNILVTTETYMPNNPRSYTAGQEIHIPPGGNDMCGFDIALVILNRSIPTSQALPTPPRLKTPPQAGETYSAHGYGHTGDGSGTGARRVRTGRRVQCEGSNCPNYTSVQGTEFLGTDGTCQGDSGGPALDSQGRVIGVLSRGPDGCRASVYSSPARWSTWIRQIGARASQLGGYTAPEWVTEGSRDTDRDGIVDITDNCVNVGNPNQLDNDNDGQGDMCDDDIDNDGIINNQDNCPTISNPSQSDGDGDGDGDGCDDDHDNDTVKNTDDNCPYVANRDQVNNDGDDLGDVCDEDDDNDGVKDGEDNCKYTYNPDQADVCMGNDKPKGNENDEEFIIIADNSRANAADDGGCSTTHPSSNPTTPGLMLLGMLVGFIGLRRRR